MEPSPELRAVIDGWFDSVAAGDLTWADRHISVRDGVRLIGTDPREFLEGRGVYEFLKGEAEMLSGNVTVTRGDSEAFREGSVGWGVARPIITLPNGIEFAPRWSGVFHREDGVWKLVHCHASLGISNEEAMGRED